MIKILLNILMFFTVSTTLTGQYIKSNLSVKSVLSSEVDISYPIRSNVTSFGYNDSGILALGFQSFDIITYDILEGEIRQLYSMNIAKGFNESIDRVIISTEPSLSGDMVYVGDKYGSGILDLEKQETRVWIGNVYRSCSQVDFDSFGDIGLLKLDIAMESEKDAMDSYHFSYLAWQLWDGVFNKNGKSLLHKIKRKYNTLQNDQSELPFFKQMLNPSGFAISGSTEYVASYDFSGLLQVYSLKQKRMIVDMEMNLPIKDVFYNEKNEILVVLQNGSVHKSCLKNDIKFIEKYKYPENFENVGFNGSNILAFSNQTKIFIVNLENFKREIVAEDLSFEGKGYIQFLEFIPDTNNLVWILNHKPNKPIKEFTLPDLDYNYNPDK